MAQPIRWDNINNRETGVAVSGINSAASLFQNAFGGLQDALKQREAIDASNYQNTKANNTTAYLDQVAKLRSVEDLKAAQPQLDALRQQFGYQIDANAVRGAVDQRTNMLMDQQAKTLTYNHMLRDERTAPLLDQMHQAALNKDEAGFNKAMAAYTAAGGVDAAGAMKYKIDRDRQVVVQGQQDQKFGDDMLTSAAQRTHLKNADANDAARVALQREGLGIQREQLAFTQEDRMENRLAQLRESMGKTANLSPGSPEGQAKIAEMIDRIKDPDIQSNARKAAARLSGEKDMTVAGVLAGIGGIDKRDWFTNGDILYSNSNNVDDAVKRGKNFVNTPDALNFEKRRELQYQESQAAYENQSRRLEEFRARRSNKAKNPFN